MASTACELLKRQDIVTQESNKSDVKKLQIDLSEVRLKARENITYAFSRESNTVSDAGNPVSLALVGY